MKNKIRNCLPWTGFAPMLILCICVVLALSGYSEPTFIVNADSMQKETAKEEAPAVGEAVTSSEATEQTSAAAEEATSLETVQEGATYVDGTYTGTGKGFGGTTTVQVVIKDGKISDVTILSHNDDTAFIEKAKSILTAIVSKQSTNVDTVSGATYSSNGIIEATRNALSKALAQGSTLEETSALAQTSAASNGGSVGGSTGQGSKTLSKVEDAAAYKDGTYYGTGTGFGGTMKVKVTVKNGKIAKVEIVSHKDGSSYINKAKSILAAIVAKQSTNVDTVSGATYSSNGIIEATRNALKNAATSKTSTADSETTAKSTTAAQSAGQSSEKETQKPTVAKVEEDATYKDGSYIGTGTGFGGELQVKVTIKKGKITKIKVVSNKDDKEFFNKAKTLLNEIVKKQSTNVDTVSGATYSSAGLIEAVRNALAQAETKKTDSQTTTNKETSSNETTSKETTAANQDTTVTKGKFPYKDGIYYGTEEGFKGDITVGVVIKNKTLTEIVITEAEDDDAFLSRAKTLIDVILQKQSVDVDVVSGATFSSNGIIGAVRNALAQAKQLTEGKTEETTQTPTTQAPTTQAPTTQAPTTAPTAADGSTQEVPTTQAPTTEAPTTVYKDGTYTAQVTCNPDEWYDFDPYTLSLTVTIQDDKIVAVTDIKGSGRNYISANNAYITRASNKVVKQIVANNSTSGVDAVSGATCSRNAILEAVEKALQSAKR